MAFIREDEELKRAAAQQKREVPMAGAAAPRFAAARAQMAPRMAPGGGTSGGRGPLLVDYLRANVGAQPLGEVTKELQQKAGRVQAQEYKGTTGGLATAEAAKAQEKTIKAVPESEGAASMTAQAQQDMESALQSFLESQRAGPKGAFATPEEAARATMDVEITAEALGTEAGRQAALQEKYGKGQTYTAGEAALDAALAGATSGAELSALAKKYGQLYETVAGKQKTAQEKFETETKKTAAEREAAAAAEAASAQVRSQAADRARAKYDKQQRKRAAQERAGVRYQQGKNALDWAIKNNAMDAYRKFEAQLYAEELADEDYQRMVKGGKAEDPFYFSKTYEDFLAEEYAAAGIDSGEAYGTGRA